MAPAYVGWEGKLPLSILKEMIQELVSFLLVNYPTKRIIFAILNTKYYQ